MGILTKHQIEEYFERGELMINAHKNDDGKYAIEPASYDFRAGTFIWKETDASTGESKPISKFYNPNLPSEKQETVTLQPGQVMFVITYEEVKLPRNICGTVYAKNCFSREGILALTTGHVDPGIQCPIVIRLINLRSIPKTFCLGEAIYTIVFEKIEVSDENKLESHQAITMEKTYERTIESVNAALGNALNDISLTRDFVKQNEFDSVKEQVKHFMKEEDFGKVWWDWTKKNIVRSLLIIVGILVTLSTIMGGLQILFDWISKLSNPK